MLYLDRPLEIAGISLYGDHSDLSTYHFLPGSPVLQTENGLPSLRLQVFRGGSNGGFLWFDVTLERPPEKLQAAREELKRATGKDANLVPVLFHEGTVRLTILNSATAPGSSAPFLVEKTIASAKPSLLGNQRAIFSVRLDPEGAVLLEESLRDGLLPATIVYELAFRGLQPATGLRAHLNYRLGYDYFHARLAADSLWFRADLSRETEALQQQGMLTIDDVDFTGHPPPDPAARRDQINRELQQWIELVFFRPAASPALPATAPQAAPALRTAWSEGGFARAAFVLRALNQEETKELVYDRTVASVAEARVAPQGLLSLPAGSDPKALIQRIDLEQPPATRTIHGFVPAGADWTSVKSFTLDVRSGAEVRSAVFTPDHLEHQLTLPSGTVECRTQGQFADEADSIGSPPPPPAFQPCTTDQLALDPAIISGRRLVHLTAIGFEAGFTAFQGDLEAGPQKRRILLTRPQPEITVPVWNPSTLRVSGVFQSASSAVPWANSFPASQTVILIQPPGPLRTLNVHLNDPLNRYSSVVVELEQVNGTAKANFRLDAAQPFASWTFAPAPGGSPFRYRTTAIHPDGVVDHADWKTGDGFLLVSGDLGLRVETIDVVWLGPELLGGLLKFTSLHPPAGIPAGVELMFEGPPTSLQAKVPFAQSAPRLYKVEGQLFTEAETIEIPAREESSEVLLLP